MCDTVVWNESLSPDLFSCRTGRAEKSMRNFIIDWL